MNLEDTFESLDSSAIQQWILDKKEEHLQLDFKRVSDPNVANRDDRKNFSKSLSGFANSSGGLIVWGIDARKNDRGIDCATALALIDPVQAFLSRLNELTGQSTSPLVDNVRHRAIHFENDRGCVVTFVPESQSGPHMAKLGEDRYYKRSGDRFYIMEHFDLEDMFGRRAKPNLTVRITRTFLEDSTNEILRFSIANTGKYLAKYVHFVAFIDNATILRTTGSMRDITELNDGRCMTMYASNDGVLHCNGFWQDCGTVELTRTIPDKVIHVDGVIDCGGMKSAGFDVDISVEDLVA